MIPGTTAPRAVLGAFVALLLLAAPASAATFNSTGGPFPIPGPNAPISVSGLPGPVTDVSVTIDNFFHDHPDDADIALVSPGGTRLFLMSDACGAMPPGAPIDLTFDDDAANQLPDNGPCAPGTVDPTDHEPNAMGEAFADYPQLNGFNGEVANGTWSLELADDDHPASTGSIASWSITITSAGVPPITISSGNDAFGRANPFPAELEVLGAERSVITDVNVLLDGVSHMDARDIDMYLEGPGGERTWLMSDVCPFNHKLAEWKVDDEAANEFFDAEGCSSGAYRPRNVASGDPSDPDVPPDVVPSAPTKPLVTSLSTFDGTDPDGTWRLFILDDAEGDAGFIANGWDLELTTRAPAPVGFAVGAQTVREGESVSVDIVRSGPATPAAGSVVVATQSDSARAGQDFEPVSQLVTFAPGETTKSVTVPIAADGPFEPEEAFSIVVGQPEGDAEVGTPAAVAVTILADAQQRPGDPLPGTERKPEPKTFTAKDAIPKPPSARRCRSRNSTIRFRPRMPDGVAITRSEVLVNGRKIEDNVGASAVAPIVLTMSGRRMRVTIRLHSHDGRVVTIRRTFRACKRKRR
jgi:subtilisin-like proprotein convertase family protein